MAADRKAAYLEAAGVALLSGVMFSGARDLEHYISHSDLGYQLSLGRQLLLGKKPFVDFFFLYGPLTGYTSALGLWLTNGVIGEVVICSLGYALSVSCLYYAVSRAWGRASLASRAGGLVVVFVALNLMSRFFKWYYWLFPLATLLCLRRAVLLVAKERPADRALLAAGFVAGVGGLYRLDLGLACVFSVCAIALLSGLRSRNPRAASVAVLAGLMGTAIPFGVWLASLVAIGGPYTPIEFLVTTLDAAGGAVEFWSLPYPTFDRGDILSPGSALYLAFPFALLTYACALGVSAPRFIQRAGECDAAHCTLLAASCVGLAIFPQALHRKDIGHFLQVLPPLLVCVSVFLGQIVRLHRPGLRLATLIAYSGMLGITGVGLWRGSYNALSFSFSDMPGRVRELARGVKADTPGPKAQFIRRVRALCPEDRSLLIAGNIGHGFMYDRRVAGIFPYYERGILDSETWRRRDLEAIQRDVPCAIIAEAGMPMYPRFLQTRQPELYAWIMENYAYHRHSFWVGDLKWVLYMPK
jgi:hypothetical protein